MAIGPRLLSAALVYWLRAQATGARGHWWHLVTGANHTQPPREPRSGCIFAVCWQSGLEKRGSSSGEALQAIALWALLQGGRALSPHSRQKSLPSFLLFSKDLIQALIQDPLTLPLHSKSLVPLLHLWALFSLQKKVIVPDMRRF